MPAPRAGRRPARILDVLDPPLPERPGGPGATAAGPGVTSRPAPAPSAATVCGSPIRTGRAPAIADFDLRVEPGEHVALVGPSGCGKSTLLAVLMRFLHPDRGDITVGPYRLDE